jgi:hypothetical protein
MSNMSNRVFGIAMVLSGAMMSFGLCRSTLDELADLSGPVMESLTEVRGPLETPEDVRERKQRARLEAEVRNSFKIVVVNGCAWKLDDGSTFAVQPGDVLVANGAKEGNYVFAYRNISFLIPFSDARQSPFTEQELAARRRELQRMYDSRDQLQELQDQTDLLDQIQTQLRSLR